MEAGALIFVRGHLLSITDDAIKLGETLLDHTAFKGNYTHVALYVGDGQVAEAQGGRTIGLAPLENYAGNYDVGTVDLTDEQRAKLLQLIPTEFGEEYDWPAILDIGLDALTGIDLPMHEVNHRICCTYANAIYKEIGEPLVDKNICTVEEVALSPKVKITKGR